MSTVTSKDYAFNAADSFSKVFPIVKFPMIRFMDGSSLNALSKVSRVFNNILKDPLVWQLKAQELRLDYSDARQEVRAFCEMEELKRGTYAFAAALLEPLTPTDFRKIPYVIIVKSSKMICWPPDTAIVTGLKYETYLNNYMPYIAFLVRDQSFSWEWARVILVIEKTSRVSEAHKEYLHRLLRGEPCGSWHNGQETTPRLNGNKSVVSLCLPSRPEHYSVYIETIMPFGLK